MAKLIYKMAIIGEIHVLTGLHIGGSDSDLDIGGIDNSVIKTKNGFPFVPGSSLKGKMRDLIARTNGYKDVTWDDDETATLFTGTVTYKKRDDGRWDTFNNGSRKKLKTLIPTRLITRDSFVLNNTEDLEDKAENTINRSTGEAKPRHIERVSPETVFRLDMILDVYDVDKVNIKKILETLDLGFRLLESDYLGGSGSRGYGKIEFKEIQTCFPYIGDEPSQEVKDFKFLKK